MTPTQTLTKAAASYLLKYRYSAFVELGLTEGGSLRADVIGLKINGEILCCEVKSSWADFNQDKKWQKYLIHCNKMVFVFPEWLWLKYKDRILEKIQSEKVGVLILCPKTGYLKSVRSTSRRKMQGSYKKNIVLRMAYRSGDYRFGPNRRQRYFLEK